MRSSLSKATANRKQEKISDADEISQDELIKQKDIITKGCTFRETYKCINNSV